MRRISSWKFGDTRKEADELVGLVILGKKRATSSLYEGYKTSKLPKVGERSIIKDSRGRNRCLIINTKVKILAFGNVGKTFAFKEGEGDRSSRYWRNVHRKFFKKAAGKKFNEDSLVVCQEFKVLKVFD